VLKAKPAVEPLEPLAVKNRAAPGAGLESEYLIADLKLQMYN
jgi:hypothetical protein